MASPLTQTDPRIVRSTASKTVREQPKQHQSSKKANLLTATDDDDFDSDIEEDNDELTDYKVAVDDA